MKTKKLKICHIITRMIVGGAQENTLLSVIGLQKKGHDVVLVTGPSPGPEGELLKKSPLTSKYNIKVVEIPYLAREVNPIKDVLAYFALKSFIKKNRFDVVHTHSSKAGIIGRAAAFAAKTPFIVHTVHGQAFHQYGGKYANFIYKALERWAAKKCHKIFAVAQAMIEQCVNNKIADRSMYKVVYSGMEIETFTTGGTDKALRKSLGIPENFQVVGTVARLFPLKGYEYFIPTAIQLAKLYPNIRFLIVGDGILKEQIEKQISEQGFISNFIFVGLIPPDEVPKYIGLMDILVHLSLREGLPRSVVQALAASKPAIAFNLDGTPEVLKNDITGYCIEPGNDAEVFNSIKKLLDNPELAKKMGETGREFVKIKFDWHTMTDILEQEYYNGLNNK